MNLNVSKTRSRFRKWEAVSTEEITLYWVCIVKMLTLEAKLCSLLYKQCNIWDPIDDFVLIYKFFILSTAQNCQKTMQKSQKLNQYIAN